MNRGAMMPAARPGSAPAARLGKQEERPQTLRVIVSRSAAPGSPPVLCRNDIVDVGHPDGAQPNILSGQPTEEVVGGPAIALYGRVGETALSAQPVLKGRDLCIMRMAVMFGFVEPSQKAQPLDSVTDKAVRALGDADRSHLRAFGCDQIAATASICGRLHPVAFLQVQKAYKAQMIVGAFPQGRSSGAGLPEMNEISFPLLDKRRCSIFLSGSGKEDVVKHTCASMLMEAQAFDRAP